MTQIHPYANLFPLCSDDEIQQLADDIAKSGLRQPIVIDEDEMILDGRNRAAACAIAGVKPVYEPFVGTDAQKLAYVVSANIHRRHLTTAQRSDIAANIATMKVGDNQHSKKKEGPSNEGPSTKVSTKAAAKLLNVSASSVERAKAAAKTPKPKAKEPPTPSAASIVLDSLGKEIPEKFREANELGITLMSIGRDLDQFRKIAKELNEQPGGEWLQLQQIDKGVRSLKGHFQDARYHTICVKCDGKGGQCCQGNGWQPDFWKGTMAAAGEGGVQS